MTSDQYKNSRIILISRKYLQKCACCLLLLLIKRHDNLWFCFEHMCHAKCAQLLNQIKLIHFVPFWWAKYFSVFCFVLCVYVPVVSIDNDIIISMTCRRKRFQFYIFQLYANSKAFFSTVLSVICVLTFVTVIWIYTNRTSKETQTHVHLTVKFKNVENHLNAYFKV